MQSLPRIPSLALSLVLLACAGEPSAVSVSPAPLASPAGDGSGEPFLSTGPDGRVHLSWLERTSDSTHALRYAALDGDQWTSPVTIAERADFFVNWADFPSVVPTSGGRLVAHWLQRNGASRYAYDIHVVQSGDSGRTWSPDVVLHRDGLQAEHGFIAIWPDAHDGIEAAWLDGRGTVGVAEEARAMKVVTTSLDAEGRLGAEVTLDEKNCDCCQVAAAVTRRGPIVAYRDRTDDEIRDIAIVRRRDGRWSQPETVHDDGWKIAACPVNGPALGASGDTVVIAWFTGAQDTARVRAAWSFDGGETFAPPVQVDDGNAAGRVDVELLGDGSAAVSWLERTDSTQADVRLRRLRADGSMGAPVVVARSSGARASGFPRITRSGETLVMAWTEPGDTSRVRLARLNEASLR